MELWQLDVMGGIWLADARSVCQVFQATLERYGVPEELLTDNGKVFTGRLGPHPCEPSC